jgi:hypothetical protein
MPSIATCRRRDHSRKHGVSDPSTRAGNRPAPVRRGRSRHGCRWSSSLSMKARVASTLRWLERKIQDRSQSTSSGQSDSGSCTKVESLENTSCVHTRQLNRMHVRVAIVSSFDVCDACADHHAFDAGSVLGTVQGSSLRDDRACARPAGLDSACAQIMSWPLCDGRRSHDP